MSEMEEAKQPEEPARPKLRLKRDAPGKACPNCGEKMAEDAVVCLRCGWNVQTGKKLHGAEAAERRKRRVKLALKAVWVLVLTAAVAAAAKWTLGHRNEAERWIDAGVEKAKSMAGGEKSQERGALEARERARLDADLPMWRVGDRVTLEKSNGAVLEGTLSRVGEETVTVETAAGEQTVGMAALSGRSRVRVDKAFREEVLRRRLDNLSKAGGT